MKLGVVADPHLSVLRDEPDGWHNPYRLGDAHERLDVALADPLLDDVDVFALLGDLAHFGDRESLRRCVDAVAKARRSRPAILLSGNHDVLAPGVRLEQEIDDAGDPDLVSPLAWPRASNAAEVFRAAGLGLHVHEVMALSDRQVEPFDVSSHTVNAEAPAGHVVLTHFPVLSFEKRAREAHLLYSAHLAQLAPPVDPLPDDGPVVVLSGHLHLRGVTHERDVLQLSFAALVEAPYELARVDIDSNDEGLTVNYECASARPPDADKLPILDPPTGRWCFRPGQGWHQPGEARW
jgi:DNA repair exonuclease SbcCD nuclease subunit